MGWPSEYTTSNSWINPYVDLLAVANRTHRLLLLLLSSHMWKELVCAFKYNLELMLSTRNLILLGTD